MGESGETRVLGLEEQDATMVDIGDKSRPPADPPDGGTLYVAKVRGFMTGGRPTSEVLMGDDFVADRLQLEFPDGADGEPVITIGEEVLEVMNSLWKQCLIVRVLGRNVGITVLNKKQRELWKPTCGMSVIDLPRQFYMVRFEKEEEYLMALTGGPWKMFGSYLLVQRWSPKFNPMSDEIITTPVWIRLSNILVNFYHRAILFGIAEGLGKPVKVDMTTLHFERARFARVCVEVDLSKPLKGSVRVNGDRYFVSYEGLSNICSGCGIYGHRVHNCPTRVVETMVENVGGNSVENVVDRPISTGLGSAARMSQDNDGFTTVVRRQGRRGHPPVKNVVFSAVRPQGNQERNLREITGHANMENIAVSNSFANLEQDTKSKEQMVVADSVEENKENQDSEIQKRKGKSIAQGNTNTFVIGEGVGKSGPRNGPKEKRQGGNKPVESSGLKSKQKKLNKPTRGLVFGPSRTEVDRSESGKRLRVEEMIAGRPWGVFTSEREEQMESEPINQHSGKNVELNSEVTPTGSDGMMLSDPPEKTAILTLA